MRPRRWPRPGAAKPPDGGAPTLILGHTPVHADRLGHVEIFFSVVPAPAAVDVDLGVGHARDRRHPFGVTRSNVSSFDYRRAGRPQLWRLLELSEVREEVAGRNLLGFMVAWPFAYPAAIRGVIQAEAPELRELRWTRMVDMLARGACLANEVASWLEREVSPHATPSTAWSHSSPTAHWHHRSGWPTTFATASSPSSACAGRGATASSTN